MYLSHYSTVFPRQVRFGKVNLGYLGEVGISKYNGVPMYDVASDTFYSIYPWI